MDGRHPLPVANAYQSWWRRLVSTRIYPRSLREYLIVALLLFVVAYVGAGVSFFAGRTIGALDVLSYFPGYSEGTAPLVLGNGEKSDVIDGAIPLWFYIKDAVSRRELPLLNDRYAGGLPTLAFAPWLSPRFPIFLFLPNGIGYGLGLLLQLTLAGLGTYVLCRRWCGVLACFFGAVTFMFCGFNSAWAQVAHAAVATAIPWMLWALVRVFEAPSARRAVVLACMLTWGIFGSFPSVFSYGCYLALGLATALGIACVRRTRRWRPAFEAAGFSAAGAALGIGLAGVALLPSIEYLRHFSFGYREQHVAQATWSDVVPLFDPFREYPRVETTVYAGLAPLVLALLLPLLLWAVRRTRHPDEYRLRNARPYFWLLALAVTFVLRFQLPQAIAAVLIRLPILSFNPNMRTASVLGLELAVIGALGVEAIRLLLGASRRRWMTGAWAKRVVVVAVAAVVMAQAADVSRIYRFHNPDVPSDRFYPPNPTIEAVKEQIEPGQSVLATTTAYAISGTVSSYGLSEWFAHDFHNPEEKALLEEIVENPWATISAARFELPQVRVDSPWLALLGIRYILSTTPGVIEQPRGDGAHHLSNAELTQEIKLDKPAEICRLAFLPLVPAVPEVGAMRLHVTGNGTDRVLSAPASDLRHNQWFAFRAKPPLHLEPGLYRFAFSESDDARPVAAWISAEDTLPDVRIVSPPGYAGDMMLFVQPCNPAPPPGFRVAHVGDGVTAFEKENVSHGAFLWRGGLTDDVRNVVADFGTVEVLQYSSDRRRYRVSTDTPARLAIGARPYPGWEALVDGKPATVEFLRGVLPSVALEAGSHEVVFAYRPASVRFGVLIGLLCLMLAGAWIGLERRFRRSIPVCWTDAPVDDGRRSALAWCWDVSRTYAVALVRWLTPILAAVPSLALRLALALSKRERLVSVVAFLLLAYASLGANLFAGRTIAPMDRLSSFPGTNEGLPGLNLHSEHQSDIVDGLLPNWHFLRSEIWAGRLPVWNPLRTGGSPGLTTFVSYAVSPRFLLFLLLPEPLGYGLGLVLQLAATGLGAYWLCRRRLGWLPATLAGITYMFCGFNSAWAQHPHTTVTMWFPWMLIALLSLLESPRPRKAAILAVFIALMLFAGFPSVAGYGFYLATALAATWLVSLVVREHAWRDVAKRVGWCCFSVVLGLALSAIQLLPTIEYLWQFPWDNRDYSTGVGLTTGVGVHPEQAIGLWDPFAFTGSDTVEQVSYVGLLPWLAVPIVLYVVVRGRQRASRTGSGAAAMMPLFWAVALLVTLIVRYDTPHLLAVLIHRMPIFSSSPSMRLGSMLGLEAAVVAAIGLEAAIAFVRRRVEGRPHPRRILIPLTLVLLGLLVLHTEQLSRVLRFHNVRVQASRYFPELPTINTVRAQLLPGQSVIPTYDGFGNSGTLEYYGLPEWTAHDFRRHEENAYLDRVMKGRWRHLTSANFGLDAIDMSSPWMIPLSVRFVFTSAPKVLEQSISDDLLPVQTGAPVVEAFAVYQETKLCSLSVRLHAERPLARTTLTASIRDLGGTELARASAKVFAVTGDNWLTFSFERDVTLPAAEYRLVIESTSADEEPVYVWMTKDEHLGSGHLVIDGQPAPGDISFAFYACQLPLPPGWRVAARGDRVLAVENVNAAPGAVLLTGGDLNQEPDPTHLGWATISAGIQEPSRRVFDVVTEAPSYLVLSARLWPDWFASVDGKAVEIHPYQQMLPAVQLEPGTHHIEWEYRPFWFKVGAAVSLVALLVLSWCCFAGRRPATVPQ